MWQRQIQCARRVRKVVDHLRRLRVVDDDVVVVVLELLRVERVVAVKRLLLLRRQPLGVALERVVNRLRDREELVLALDDPPLHVQADVLHEWDQGVVDLGHATPEGRRREMDDPLSLQRFGQSADLVHHPARGE